MTTAYAQVATANAYKRLINKPQYFPQSLCLMEESDIRPWSPPPSKNLIEPELGCRSFSFVGHQTKFLGMVPKHTRFKITKITTNGMGMYMEVSILSGRFSGMKATYFQLNELILQLHREMNNNTTGSNYLPLFGLLMTRF